MLYSSSGGIPSKGTYIASMQSKYAPVSAITPMAFVDSDGTTQAWQPAKWERVQFEPSGKLYVNNFILGRDYSYLMYCETEYIANG